MTPTPMSHAEVVVDLPVLRRVRAPFLVRLFAVILVAMGVVLAVSLAVVPWQQSAPGYGRVVGYAPLDRQQAVEAPVDGRVARFVVREGTRLKSGDLIAEMSDIDPRFFERLEQERGAVMARRTAGEDRVRSVQERIEALTQSRSMALDAARARIDMATDRMRAAAQAVEQAEAAFVAAERNLPRVVELAEKGLRSVRDRELAELDFARARTELERARAARAAADSERESLVSERERIGNDAEAAINDARATLNIAKAEVAAASVELTRMDVRVSRQENQRVLAPRDGTVLRLIVTQDGQIVKQGDPLIILVPDDSERAVELWVDGNDAPLIAAGRKVRLQFEGWPALQFVGWPSVAVGTFGGSVALVDTADDGKGRFRIVVVPDAEDAPWPPNRYLRQGVRANGWVLLETVSLGFELWRRFNGFPPVVGEAAGADKANGVFGTKPGDTVVGGKT